MNDREVQDEIIRFLTEPAMRGAPSSALPIAPEQAARAAHFAQFLARRYYRDRLGRSFRYSAMLAKSGRRGVDVVESEQFDRIVASEALGSLGAAQRIGALAREHLVYVKGEPWWPALLDYEYAHFLQTATSESRHAGQHPQRGASALCRQFEWNMPELLQRIKTKQSLGDASLQRPVTLLFSRTHTGRIFVMEVDAATAVVFGALDGQRSAGEIAAVTKTAPEVVEQILQSLREVGAVV
jgi:hypothetical protein